MSETALVEKLRQIGFVANPNLPGRPDFALFDAKLALCFASRDEYQNFGINERVKFNIGFRERFAELRLKRWQCRLIYKEDSIEYTINHLNEILVTQEAAKINLPKGALPTYKKLIALLKQTDEALISEEKKRKCNRSLIWGLKKRRKNIEQRLHVALKPVVLKRDNYRCRTCGSVENLELARISGGDMAKPEKLTKTKSVWIYPDAEKRWAEENMLILCEDCHKRLDSFNARWWRRGISNLTIDQAIDLLQSGKLTETAPILKTHFEDYALSTRLDGIKTFFKVLRKAIIFHKRGYYKQSKLYVGHVKRAWRFIAKENILPNNINETFEHCLQYGLGSISIVELEQLELEVRDGLIKSLEKNIPPDLLSEFKEAIAKQDILLSKI